MSTADRGVKFGNRDTRIYTVSMATIIFDLDGTLIDSSRLVLPAYKFAIRHFPGHDVPSDDTMNSTFGMPDPQIWETLMPHATNIQRQEAYVLAGEFVQQAILKESILLPHALDVLTELKARKHVLTVASNCGEDYLDAVLDSQGLRPYFTHPLCLGLVRGQQKADILTRHFEHFSRAGSVMVGDRHSDIEAAEHHGIPSVGCSFGFGQDEELRKATTVIRSLPELLPLFPSGATSIVL